MAEQVRSNAPLLETYDTACMTLDPIKAAEYTASEHDVSLDHVEGVIWARESRHLSAE